MQIKLLRNEHGIDEWLSIEIQGNFEFQSESNVSGKALGHFAWLDESSACIVIGHQLLQGELKTLERPFLIISKPTIRDSSPGNSDAEEEGSSKVVDIVGIIKRKIVFKDRPKPIITNAMEY